MKNNEKIKNISKSILSSFNNNFKIPNLNNSYQFGNSKLKLNNSFFEKISRNNFKKSIFSKISQLQINQQKTNLKLSSLITILLSKLLKIQTYSISHSNFSILKPNKIINSNNNEIKRYIESHLYNETKKEKKENLIDINEKNKNMNNNKTVRKIGTISLETELEIRRYTLSNQKTKTKEQIFKNKEKKEKNKNEEDNNFYNNLFKINYNNNILIILIMTLLKIKKMIIIIQA